LEGRLDLGVIDEGSISSTVADEWRSCVRRICAGRGDVDVGDGDGVLILGGAGRWSSSSSSAFRTFVSFDDSPLCELIRSASFMLTMLRQGASTKFCSGGGGPVALRSL
jgi:hypothetical protein